VVDSTDLMQINGETKKIYFINYVDSTNSELYTVVLEDFGNLYTGPTYPWCFNTNNYECFHELLCIYQGDILVYTNPNETSCYINTLVAVKEIQYPITLSVYPNPFNSFLNIQINETLEGYTLEVFDTSGKLRGKKYDVNNSDSINLEFLESGFYILSFQSQGRRHFERILKM